MSPANGRPGLSPARILVGGFAGAIALGTVLLVQPGASADGTGLSFVDALFTATSATCVTGLVVVPTGAGLSLFGQLVVLALIQIGGLGIMTMSTLFAMVLGRRISLRNRLVIHESLGQLSLGGLVRLVRHVAAFTFVLEATGAALLAWRFSEFLPPGRAAYYGVFHAVSAFCNAGFDLFGTSFEGFVGDPMVNGVVMTLVVVGGLGFLVMAEFASRRSGSRLSLHTRMVVSVTLILLAVGTVCILVLEAGNPATLGPLSWGEKVMASLFHAVTPRTAGFNTLRTASLGPPALLLTLALMFIGASPGSTGGGIKTTTFATLVAWVVATLRGRSEIEVFERRLPREVADRALTISVLSLGVILSGTWVLLLVEKGSFLEILFETTSAYGTVGLSLGLTPRLTEIGRVLVPIVMFVGRLGPLTLGLALAQRRPVTGLRYPEERVVVG